MVSSPFAFLRGSAAVMAADLASTPRTNLMVQACGDCHLSNFGVFATPERALIFGINDFDETYPGPWEWDVKRLATSVLVAMRFAGLSESDGRQGARAAVAGYREYMRELASLPYLALWYERITAHELLSMLSPDIRKRAQATMARARKRTHLQTLEKLTERSLGGLRIIEDRPLIVREKVTYDGTPVADAMKLVFEAYRQTLVSDRRVLFDRYRVVDVARKVVGVGSVGLFAWVVLMLGQDDEDPLVLQIKQAQSSVLHPWLKTQRYASEGERVVMGQRLLQGAPDIFLGWGRIREKHFYLRQLRDMKGSITIEPGKVRSTGMQQYARACGRALALAHARSSDAALIAGYLGKTERFDDAVVRFARAYADQTERDHALMKKAIKAGRLKAVIA
jgi:uncharacterized protein (DUF2252 family)